MTPKWLPIETAPNDGTVVLLAIERSGYSGMTLAYQKGGQWFKEETDDAFGGWTHWMPLPTKPAPALTKGANT